MRSEAGYPVQVGSRFTATPYLNLTYSNLSTNAYNESGGDARTNYSSTSSDSFKTGLGARVSTPVKLESGATLTPELSLAWSHEFMDDQTKTAGSIAVLNDAPQTTLGGKTSRDAALIGVGMTFANQGNLSLSGNYDAEVKSDYVGHTGRLQVRYAF
ncbi:hypothetical protein WCLP8_1450001 [uncultured Gammaproteobacteria bacterium]